MSEPKQNVVVLGAGVLGLSIAKQLAERSVDVTVVARDLPEDVESAGFASPWAGANWSSFSESAETTEARWDTITFHHYAQLSKSHPHAVARKPFKRVWNDPKGYTPPWFKDLVFGISMCVADLYAQFRPLKQDELPPGFKYGETFESYTMNPPAYLAYLSSELARLSVRMVRARLSALDEAYSLPSVGHVDLVINATGLGARALIGVEDDAVYPIRGDTVIVRAPNVGSVYKILDKHRKHDQGQRFYIIPRPGEQGHVTLGGTELDNDWDTLPRAETVRRILQDAYTVCPDLSNGQGWEQIEVTSCNVGLRPARKGGPRVELEHRALGQTKSGIVPTSARTDAGRKVGVVHAYGIGPAGFQTSVGIAQDVANLVNQYFAREPKDKINGISGSSASLKI